MIYESQAELRDRIEELTPRRAYGVVPVFEDTSSYMSIHGGAVLRLAGHDYFVMGDTKEGRFGIDDQPKFWVKYAVDLETGQQKIIKLVFHEQFLTTLAGITMRCRRNPDKESAFLEAARGNARFMQGVTVRDAAGNNVRIIDFIRGKSLYNHLAELTLDHETYFATELTGVMEQVLACMRALAELHRQGHHHGDVRNDHIIVESGTGLFRWIDFDYEVNFADYDVWSMGNIITYVAGKGAVTFHDVQRHPGRFPAFAGVLDEHDALLFYGHRVANLRKLHPHVPRGLNDVLMRFSAGAIDFYEDLDSQVADLEAALAEC